MGDPTPQAQRLDVTQLCHSDWVQGQAQNSVFWSRKPGTFAGITRKGELSFHRACWIGRMGVRTAGSYLTTGSETACRWMKPKQRRARLGQGERKALTACIQRSLTLEWPQRRWKWQPIKFSFLLSQSKFGFCSLQPRGLIKTAVDPQLGSFSIGRMKVLDSYWKIQDRFGQVHDFWRYSSPSFIKTNQKPELEPKSRDNGGFGAKSKRAMQNTGSLTTGKNPRSPHQQPFMVQLQAPRNTVGKLQSNLGLS